MRFWDSSAMVPLLLEQPVSERARALLGVDAEMVAWWGTPVECASALARPHVRARWRHPSGDANVSATSRANRWPRGREGPMAKKGGGRGQRGGQPPIKGFRPGKAPPQLKKQRAKAQLPRDASWAQKQAVEAVAGRTPEEIHAMVRRWILGTLVVAVLLTVAGAFLYAWSVVVGVIVHVLALALFFLVFRLRKHGQGLVEMAKSLR
jgi:hypothetical protein